MFALPGLIFLLLKIIFYSAVYSILLLLILSFISSRAKISWLKRVTRDRKVFFTITFLIIGFAIFKHSFSYWGDPGHGDNARIPFGNNYEVFNIDGSVTFLNLEEDNRQLILDKFIVKDGVLYAEFKGDNSSQCESCILIFKSHNGELQILNSRESYQEIAIKDKLPNLGDFKSFMINYRSYWNANDTWFLP